MSLNLLSGSSSRQPKNQVEFRAGKMSLQGNMVHADKRKGLVYIYQSDDNLTHFCWKDRKTGTVEDDLIVFPDDCEYKKVTQCKEGSRVFMLKFKVSARKLFFWMQEPKADSDDDYIWKVNDALNNPGGSSGRGSTSGNVTPSASDQEMQNLLGSMSQSQLMQLLGGMSDIGGPGLLAQLNQLAPGLANLTAGGSVSSSGGTATESGGSSGGTGAKPQSLLKVKKPSTQVPKAPSASPAAGPIQLQDLQSILNRIQPAPPSVQVDLATGVNSDAIRRITSCPNTVKKLVPLLPQFGGPEASSESSSESTQQDVEETLKSPQFQSALSSFCAAFPTGQLGPLISQFGMGVDAVTAAQNGNLEAFINAIQKEANESTPAAPTATDIVEDMNVD